MLSEVLWVKIQFISCVLWAHFLFHWNVCFSYEHELSRLLTIHTQNRKEKSERKENCKYNYSLMSVCFRQLWVVGMAIIKTRCFGCKNDSFMLVLSADNSASWRIEAYCLSYDTNLLRKIGLKHSSTDLVFICFDETYRVLDQWHGIRSIIQMPKLKPTPNPVASLA